MQRLAVRREMNAPEAGPGVTRTAARNGARVPMPAGLRRTIFGACTLLWLSGCLWLVLHFGFTQATPFGALPNPWEPVVMRVHGAIAVIGVFLLGWVAAGHLVDRWGGTHNRVSGIVLAGSAALLVVSGYALYYTTGTLHEFASWTHEVLGVASLIAALTHWWRVAASAAREPPRAR